MNHLTDADYELLAHHLQRLMEQMDQIPFLKIRDRVFELLQALDALHREALARLLQRIESESPELRARLEDDFVLRTVLMLYDFIPPEEAGGKVSDNGFVARDDVGMLDSIKRPIWIPGGHVEDLEKDRCVVKDFQGVSVLMCRVDDSIYAVHNRCARSILPIDGGTLEGRTIVCPWHGCRYDLRTGAAQDDSEQSLTTFPVHVGDDGRFSVGFNIES